jgi:hypothetical protein
MLTNEAVERLRQRVLAGDPTVTDEELTAGLDAVANMRQTSATTKAASAAKTPAIKIDVMALLKKVGEKRNAEGGNTA